MRVFVNVSFKKNLSIKIIGLHFSGSKILGANCPAQAGSLVHTQAQATTLAPGA